MGSQNLALTLAGKHFSITPLPAHIQSYCAFEARCGNLASHRLLLRRMATVQLLCDTHTLAWAQNHRHTITTADRPAAAVPDPSRPVQ